MRYLRYLVLAAVALCLIVLAVANREEVMLRILPETLADAAQVPALASTIQLPLFIVIFVGIGIGVLLGFVWEWFREHKHRSEASRKTREVGQLKREVKKLKDQKNEGKDEVLALLDDAV
ncbi:MAG: LapA family protein [Pseudomonadota bacterium]